MLEFFGIIALSLLLVLLMMMLTGGFHIHVCLVSYPKSGENDRDDSQNKG